jgi:Tfp pilus assembly protein PilX
MKGGERMNRLLILRKIIRADDQKGVVLVAGLLVVLILTILSLAGMMNTGTELRISANDRSAKEAFYAGEAGVEDARSRLLTSASPSPIPDNQPNHVSWTSFVGTQQRAQQKGYDSSSCSIFRYDKVNSTTLDYVVTLTHKLDASNHILKWGDSNGDGLPEENTTTGNNIYVITSEGYTSTGAVKPMRIECTKPPGVPAPAALYTKESTTIMGTSTNLIGMDGCGTSSVPGIVTRSTVNQNGHPSITGSPVPMVQNSTMNMDVQALVNSFKNKANYSYNVNSGSPPVQNWGTPVPGATQQSPSSCSARNIVYINTNNTYVRLTGGASGCGILLVDGDLDVHGGFQWYGVVLVTGSLTFTGGGGKNVTGAMLAGGTGAVDVVGGDANIIYCSQAVQATTDNLPMITLRWVEIFG